jgi:integrase
VSNNKGHRRPWGAVRQLPSGRYQARYLVPATGRHVSLGTFVRKTDAQRVLDHRRSDQERGVALAPQAGKVLFREYATDWVDHRPNLRPRTRATYRSEVAHLIVSFGDHKLEEIQPAEVRRWHGTVSAESGLHRNTVAKVYKRFRQIMGQACEDGVIVVNPVHISGAGEESWSDPRPPTPQEVERIVTSIAPRWGALVVTAAWCGLRFGEAVGLVRANLDLEEARFTVDLQGQQLPGVGWQRVDPKSEASARTRAIPPDAVPLLTDHLRRFVGPEPEDLVFTGAKGGPLYRSGFTKQWQLALARAGVRSDLRFHDLRAFHGTEMATAGASVKEIMARLGQSTPEAAMRYLAASTERDEELALKVSRSIPMSLSSALEESVGPRDE